MKERQKLGYFITGFLVAIMISTLVSPTFAALINKTIQVSTGVNLYLDDNKFIPKDVNGNQVPVFVYNGTTYLPARAISEAVGKPVQWEGATSSVYIGKHSSKEPAVLLQDMNAFYEAGNGSLRTSTAILDNLGNTQYNCLYYYAYLGSYYIDNTYKINGEYSRISGTLFLTYDNKNTTTKPTIEIYGDGKLLYTATVTGGVEPISFNVDLTGVLELKFYMRGSAGAISNFGLYT